MTDRRLRVVPVSQYRRRLVETLTPKILIPLRTVAILVGWQGIGKGTLEARIAADETKLGHAVGFVAEEDSFEAVIRPRLEAADADLDLVFRFQPDDPDDLAGVLVPRDNAEIERIARETGMRVVFIDPWTNHVDVPDIDKGSVRRALMPLAATCERADITAILAAHPNRRDTDDPLAVIAHASAVSQVARSAFHVVIDPTFGSLSPKENPHRLLIHGKTNLTRYGDTIRFDLVATLLPAADGQPEVDTVRAEYTGTCDAVPDYASYRQLARRVARDTEPRPGTAAALAAAWLRSYLADGPQLIAAATAAGKDAGGWGARTIQRAAQDIGVVTTRPPGQGATAPASWSLSVSPTVSTGDLVGETGETLRARGLWNEGETYVKEGVSPVSPTAPPPRARDSGETLPLDADLPDGW